MAFLKKMQIFLLSTWIFCEAVRSSGTGAVVVQYCKELWKKTEPESEPDASDEDDADKADEQEERHKRR